MNLIEILLLFGFWFFVLTTAWIIIVSIFWGDNTQKKFLWRWTLEETGNAWGTAYCLFGFTLVLMFIWDAFISTNFLDGEYSIANWIEESGIEFLSEGCDEEFEQCDGGYDDY